MRHLIVYLLYRAVSALATALGRKGAAGAGCLLGVVMLVFDGRRARILRQMSKAVGVARARRLLPRYYEHMGLSTVEFLRLGSYRPGEVATWMRMEGQGRLREILSRGKGAFFVTGHVGNWELTGRALVSSGLPLLAIDKPLRNPRMDAHLRRRREECGITCHEKADGTVFVLKTIRDGRAYGLMMDQDGSGHGVFVPFFGELASTVPTAARIARRTGAAVVPVTSTRARDRVTHVLRVGPEVELVETGDEALDAVVNTHLASRAIQEAILEHPAQWLWSHRRWQSKPKPADLETWANARAALGAPGAGADPPPSGGRR
jgi:KDO2-lipid IV(A) lauroyltransferase